MQRNRRMDPNRERHVILPEIVSANVQLQPPRKKMMTRASLLAVALLIAALPCAAAEKGDASNGKTLIYTCGGCHGVTGWKNPYPNYHVPKIGGQNYDYLVNALTEYKNGERSHPTMRAQGESLSDKDIRDIATYLSGLTP